MRQEYGWRSLVIAIVMALMGAGVIVQMLRIQNSPEAQVFRD